jgi:hypothetical protein
MPPNSLGPYQAVKQALSIFSPFNKVDGGRNSEGNPELSEEYTSKLSDEDIIQLAGNWRRDYETYYNGDISKSQETAYNYWIGKQSKGVLEDMVESNRGLVDNVLFESLETFLPIATRANPEPLVTIDPMAADQEMADLVRSTLTYQADKQKLRMLLKAMVRDWALYRIGIIKLSWDFEMGDIRTEVINPKRMIFDKDGYWADGGIFTGEYLGEKKMLSASKLISLFPKHETYIMSKAGGKKGTKLEIVEWWYLGTDFFYTMGDKVLGKYKNYLWNYDAPPIPPQPGADPAYAVDGTKGVNHFAAPMAPYIGLSIFSTRTQPHDDTSLIMQNLGIQDLINRRYRQIDHNAEMTNNGLVVNGKFNSEQAALAGQAIRKGGTIRVPGEETDVTKAVAHINAPPLAATVYESMKDSRSELRNLFGTAGSSAQGLESTDTARGKILINQQDSSRIGGGITEYIEQVADTWFNWVLQIEYVHYDEPHWASSLGTNGAQELTQIRSSDLQGKILITVKEGSLIPKDPLTRRNEAIDLWSANAIDPISLYQKLDYPDPHAAAENLLKWQLIQKGVLPPQALFPDFQAPPAQLPQVQPGTGGPAVSPPIAQGVDNQSPAPQSPPAVQAQESQLISSVPLPK